jgi:AraC-like DNA-binding protein
MTRPSYRLIHPQANRSFVFKWEAFDLTTRWHCHPELELIYFRKGRANSVIGDGFTEFDEGDLVLLGANFPHVLQENPEYAQQHPGERPFGLIIQFTEDFLGESFKNAPELQPLRNLFQRAKRGLQFGPQIGTIVKPLLEQMHEQHDTRKLIQLLDVLVYLAESSDYHYLMHQDYYFDLSYDEERMWNIKQYVYANFQESISIAQAAEIANMSETAFCRYFKTRTLKTFTRFLNEVRIAYACKLLQKKDYSVTQACFESGFNSLSYFDRTFKEIVGKPPMLHRKLHAVLEASAS